MSQYPRNDDILEPFRIARRLEEEGRQFFQQAAAETESRLAQQTFEFLAREEDKHIEKIDRFYTSLEESGGKDCPEIEKSDAEQRLAAFNDMLAQLKDEIKPTVTDIEAYRLALKFENGAEEFYAAQIRQTDNPRITKFYRWLIEEEKMHARLLKSCLNFVENPGEWFRKRR
ncbi:MAG TPA: ferritin family protein [Candidatus Deferrimicrobium sp.]|nr:ferritin family protein [Candidatus Deferrimicrobium sp.]